MGWETSDRKSDLPPNWDRIRIRVLRRDRYICQIRLQGCTKRASDVDHIGSRTDHSLLNLQSACAHCHGRKSSQEGHNAKRRLRDARKRPDERHPGALDA